MTVVGQILDRMNGITKPQRKFILTLLTTIFVTRGHLNFLNLSRHSSLNEKTFRRHFQQGFDFVTFNQLSMPQAVPAEHIQLLAQDASFSAKSGKHTYGLDHFWNGTSSKVERGLEVSLISIVDVAANRAFALSAQQTPPQVTATQKERRATRIDFYLEHLRATVAYLPAAVKYGVFDGFYAKQKFVAGVCQLGYQVISKLRADANLRYLYEGSQKRRGRRRLYDGKVSFADLRRFDQLPGPEAHLTLYTTVVWSVSLQSQVRVVVVLNTKDKKKPRYVVLFSTDTELAATAILRYYKARFQIEFIFRDAKQFAGFSDCQARDQQAMHFHFNASVTAVNVARLLAQAEDGGEGKFVFSMASLKQRYFNEHLLNLFIEQLGLEPSGIKNHPQYHYLRSYGAIAA
jgi:hypothetical protein